VFFFSKRFEVGQSLEGEIAGDPKGARRDQGCQKSNEDGSTRTQLAQTKDWLRRH
jgi:hypothetical protein